MVFLIGYTFKLDGDFGAGVKKLIKRTPERLKKGAKRAALRLGDDALNLAPKPRIDTGFLRRSLAIFIGQDKVQSGGTERGGLPDADEMVGTVAFDASYAAKQHELDEVFQSAKPERNTDSGAKFLEDKIERFRDEYIEEIVADLLED